MAKRTKAALNARVRLPANKPKKRGRYCNPRGLLYISHVDGLIVTRPNTAEYMAAVSP